VARWSRAADRAAPTASPPRGADREPTARRRPAPHAGGDLTPVMASRRW